MLKPLDRGEGLEQSRFHLFDGVGLGESVLRVRVCGGEVGEEDGSLKKMRTSDASQHSVRSEEEAGAHHDLRVGSTLDILPCRGTELLEESYPCKERERQQSGRAERNEAEREGEKQRDEPRWIDLKFPMLPLC